METETREKAVLSIRNGMIFDAIMPDEQVLFSGVVDNFNGDTLYLLSPTGGEVPPVGYGAEVKLRCELSGDHIAVYHGTVLGSRSSMWKIGELCDWYGWNRRDYYRQSTAIDARVLRVRREHPENAKGLDMFVPCKLLDVSGSGVLMACSQAVYDYGDHLQITDAEILENDKSYTFLCSVKRIEKARSNYIYGCRIFGMDDKEQDRLIRAVFRLQLEARRKRAEEE